MASALPCTLTFIFIVVHFIANYLIFISFYVRLLFSEDNKHYYYNMTWEMEDLTRDTEPEHIALITTV